MVKHLEFHRDLGRACRAVWQPRVQIEDIRSFARSERDPNAGSIEPRHRVPKSTDTKTWFPALPFVGAARPWYLATCKVYDFLLVFYSDLRSRWNRKPSKSARSQSLQEADPTRIKTGLNRLSTVPTSIESNSRSTKGHCNSSVCT